MGYRRPPGGGSGGGTDSLARSAASSAQAAANSKAPQLLSAAAKTSNFTATPNTPHYVDATAGAITATLPASTAGQLLAVKKVDSSANIVTLSGTINGATANLPLRTQDQGKYLVADGSGGWNIVAGDVSLAALDLRYPTLASPAFTGTPTVPTATVGTNTTQAASTAFVIANAGSGGGAVSSVAGRTGAVILAEGDVTNLTTDLAAKAPLASPTFTGIPVVPTATLGTNTTQAASTAFVIANATGGSGVTSVAGRTGAVVIAESDVTNLTSDLAAKAPLASPTFTGTPAVPTATAGTNSTQVASTAFVSTAVSGSTPALLASNYGFATGNSAAANDTALAAAITAAQAANAALYLGAGTFNISATINCKATASMSGGYQIFGAGRRGTIIVQTTDTADILQVGGFNVYLHDFAIKHSSDSPGSTTGDGLSFFKAAYSQFERLQITNCGRSITISQSDVNEPGTSAGTGNYMFSNTFTDINILRFSKNGLYLDDYNGGGSTQSVWTNIYVQNLSTGGTQLAATGNAVDLATNVDAVFNGLNIEDFSCATSKALALNASCNVTVTGLHLERVHLPAGSHHIDLYGKASLTLNEPTIAYSDLAVTGTTGTSSHFRVAAGGRLYVDNLCLNHNVNTGAATYTIVEVGDTNTGNVVEFGYYSTNTNPTITAVSNSIGNAGLKRIGDVFYTPAKGLNWQAAAVTTASAVAPGASYRLDTTTGTFVATLTPGTTTDAEQRLRVKWTAGSAAPTVAASGGTNLDPTWSGFGVIGDAADFSLDTGQSPAVWQLV